MNHFRTSLGMAVILALVWTVNVSAQRPKPKETMIKGHTMYTLLKPGGIPAIFDPTFIGVEQADEFYHPNEPLMIVTGENEVYAYSTWHLDHHEIVNHFIDGKAISVTW